MTFKAKLTASEDATGSLLCLGLDPEPDLLPPTVERSPAGIARFVGTMVEAVGETVSSYKLNLAFYERWGREASWLLDQALATLPKDRPVILDAKRGDVGSTAQAYAHAMFEAWRADAVTVHPYLGYDSVAPFLAHKDKEVFIVCRTSNPGASEFQHLRSEGEALYRHIARAGVRWDHHDNIGFVVGATAPAELRDVRQIAGDRLLLVPGIGAQGGDLASAVRAALRPDGRGAIIPMSRGILFASSGADYPEAARAAALRYRDAINALRPAPATASA
ncbi:MAG TPA: orotidine-5'-phosphate decarboxylase [Candidatus Dormibacteraeota bacterium]|nr:orotidine-5'-phosphate decarboxylase [Candidatus Dormibacteraeota bacterium]